MNWKAIDNFPDYMISDCGLVKSLQRKIERFNGRINHLKTINERILKPSLTGGGYLFVCLRKNNKHFNRRIHQLVAEHFVEGKKNGLVVHHKDADKENNHFHNLEYISKQKNTIHYFAALKQKGKIPIGDIVNIMHRINNGESCLKVAKEYRTTRNIIAAICNNIALTGNELTLTPKEEMK